MKIISENEQHTYELARELANKLDGGEIITLDGELGAGKTVFVKGLASGLGIDPELVTSPTFALMNDYEGRLTLYHIDAYRLGSGIEAYEAGLTEFFGEKGSVCCIEWAENIKDALIGKIISVKIEYTENDSREIEINDK